MATYLVQEIKNIDREGQDSEVQAQFNQDSFTATDVYCRLNQVKFDNNDLDNAGVWSGVDQINSFINQAIKTSVNGDELAYYIGPNNFGFNSTEGIKDIAQHICRKEGISNSFYGDKNSLDKPFIVISNTATVHAEISTDVNHQGGTHWISWVLLPKKYDSLSGKEINNDKYQVLFFDSLSHYSFSEDLKKFLTEGGEVTEKTDEGDKQIRLMPFCAKEEIYFKTVNDLTGQQMNGNDCGWWATYYALMSVYTGGAEFLEELKGKKLSANPLRRIMSLQESIKEQPKKQERPNEESCKLLDSEKKSQGSKQQSRGLSADRVKGVKNDLNAGSSQQSSFDDNWIKDKTWTSNKEHAAGEAKRSLHGYDYQLKLLMLFASKGENSKIVFRLATEMAEAEKFDDLVFRYTDGQGNIKYRFLQAKHRQFLGEENKIKVSDLIPKSKDNDFSLQKYFVSYLKDIEKEEFRDGEPEDFTICTNTDFDFEPSKTKNEQKKTIERKKRWKTYLKKIGDDRVLNLGGERYQFTKDKIIRPKIISELKPRFQEYLQKNNLSNDNIEKKINDFLNILVFAVKQPSGESLERQIKDTIGNEFNLINDIIYNNFFKFMSDWMKHRLKNTEEEGGGRAHFLENKDIKDFLSEARETIASLGLISSTLSCKREIEKFGLEFKDNIKTVKEIKKFLGIKGEEEEEKEEGEEEKGGGEERGGGSKKRILIVLSKSGLLSKIKIFQMLASHDENSIFSDLKSLSLLKDSSVDPVSAFSSKERNYLITENLSTLDKDAKDLLSSFYQIVIKEPSKKLILIIQPEQKDNIEKLFEDIEDKNYFKTIEDNDNKLKDLTSKSQEKILETEITLFGKKRNLTSLTTDASKVDLYSAIDGDALTTLINGDMNVIGSEHKYDFDTYIDIPRTLTYQTKIDKKCLEENKNDLFAISGIEKSDFFQLIPKEEKKENGREFVDKDHNEKDPIRFIRLDSNRDIKKDFDQLCLDYKEHIIHLLENKDSELEWKQSHGSLFNLRRFVLKTENQEKKINDLTDSAIIGGEPGMGKSTILTTVSIKTGSLWHIRVNLKDYETHIYKANFDDLSGIVGFLCNVIDPASQKSPLIKNLLQYCLKQQGQVTLLLDGYDEIKNHNQEKVVRLLRTLKTTQGKVLITTRSYARSELEDALGIFAFSLNPFNKKQQQLFLKKFWVERFSIKESTQEEKIDKFTDQLLSHFRGLNLMKNEGLVGIVLQARMVAEIFQNDCKGYLEHENFNLSKRITNIFDLYENFIEYQYERYLKERIEISAKLSGGNRTSLTRSYTKAYGNLALKSLFSKDQIQELLRKKRFSGEELQDIGLIKILKNDGTADFLHPTYTEYFAADFLIDALGKEKNHPKYRAVHKFLLMQIFRDRNKVIYDFIENKIKESDCNLSSKWKEIQNRNLLEGHKITVELQLSRPRVELQLSRPPYDATSEKGLIELQEDVEKCMNWCDGRYYYNNDSDAKLIEKLFLKFLGHTDIEALGTTLEFLLKANGNSLYGKANAMFSSGDNIGKAVTHYFTQLEEREMLNHVFVSDTIKYYCVKAVVDTDFFLQLNEILNNLKDPKEKDKKIEYLKKLTDFLIPGNIKTIEKLRNLRYLHYYLDIFYPSIIKDVKSYITSPTESTHEQNNTIIKTIIDSLNGIRCGNNGSIDSQLGDIIKRHSGGSFITDILYHPSVISDTKSYINKIYKDQDQDLHWLERQGVLISRVLEILTPEMSESFNSVLDGTINGFTSIYSEGVFVDLINYFLRSGLEKLLQIDRLAFLKMLVHFVGFSVEANRKFPFTSEQLKTTLEFVKGILNEQYQPIFVVSKSVEYLLIIGKAGLKVIDVEKEILVLDNAGEFKHKLSSDYTNKVVELIKWKNENPSESQKKFLQECYKIVELKKGSFNRRGSESNLQELKRLKVKNCRY